MNKVLIQDFKYIFSDKKIDWSKLAGKTIVFSGANGFLPMYMIKTLLYINSIKMYNPINIVCLVRNIKKAQSCFGEFFFQPNIQFIEQDVCEKLNYESDVDYIVHAASQASPKYFFSDPVGTINANVLGTNNLLRFAFEKKVKSFLFFSTGEVNGDIFDKKNLVSENDYGVVDPLIVRNCYSESKRMGENMCVCWYKQYNVPAKIVRPSHTYGPGFNLEDGRVFASFVSSILKNKNIVIKSDGLAKRSFCYVADAVRAYFLVLLNGENGQAYNVSNDYEISIKQLAELLINISENNNIKIEYDYDKNKISSASLHGLLDNKKVKELGWSPNIKEEEGFKRTIESFGL